MFSSIKLSVNVDHVATLRQARRVTYPDPLEAALAAEAAGADGITVHLRGDRRHIQEADIEALRERIVGKLNLEMAPTDEMVAIATRLRPGQVTLVPERPDEVTTEGGLDLTRQDQRVQRAAAALREVGVAVSLFLDPEEEQLARMDTLGHRVAGFELNTDAYTRQAEPAAELEKLARIARQGAAAGFRVFAGHGLTTANVVAVSAIPEIEELNIGHSIVARAVIVGIARAVGEMKAAMATGRRRHA